MAGYLLENDLVKTRAEAVAVYNEVLSAFMARGTEENHQEQVYFKP
jgi:protein-tyrosine phosphatase